MVVNQAQVCRKLEEGLLWKEKGLLAWLKPSLDLVGELEARTDGAEQAGMTTPLTRNWRFPQCGSRGMTLDVTGGGAAGLQRLHTEAVDKQWNLA